MPPRCTATLIAVMGRSLVMVPLAFSPVRRVETLPQLAGPAQTLPEAPAVLGVADA